MTQENPIISLKSGLIALTGEEAQNFLQGLITTDVREISSQQFHYSVCCNSKGRVIATFKLFKYKDVYYLALPEANVTTLLSHFKKYALFSKVKIQECSHFYKLGIIGQENILKLYPDMQKIKGNCWLTPSSVILQIPGNTPRFEVYSEETIPHLLQVDHMFSQWIKQDILNGIPNIYPQTTALFTPQMMNYERLNGISFSKGCYLGQEIIARTANLGVVKKHLHIVTLPSEVSPLRGDPLYDELENEIGTILDTAQEDHSIYVQAVIQDSAYSRKVYYHHRQNSSERAIPYLCQHHPQ